MAIDLRSADILIGVPGLNGGGVTVSQLNAAVADRAPASASYITKVAESGLSGETALASLSTGLLKVTTGTGALSTATGADLPSHTHTSRVVLPFVIDGGGAVITTGGKGYTPPMPFAGTIKSWTVLGEQVNGLIQIDVWKGTYANYPPTSTITGTDKPRISSTGNKAQSTALTGWNTTVNVGDIFGFNVDSVTSMVKVTVSLEIERTV